MKYFLLLLIPIALFAQSSVMVDSRGRVVYPEWEDFMRENEIASKYDIGGSGSGSGGTCPLIKIDMSGGYAEAELKVKYYNSETPDYWFSTLSDENYLSFARRDPNAQVWFVCPRKLLFGLNGDDRDYVPFLPAYWNGLSDQLTDMTRGVHFSRESDFESLLIEPDIGGFFPDNSKISDVWNSENSNLKPVFKRITQTSAEASWQIAEVQWRQSKLSIPKNEGTLLKSSGDFQSVENSAYFSFKDGGTVEYLAKSTGEILFTSKNPVFAFYGQSIVAFTVKFPEFSGTALMRVGILNRHTASESFTSTMYLIFVGNVPTGSTGYESIYEPAFQEGSGTLTNYYSKTTETSVNKLLQTSGNYKFDSETYSGQTVRVVGFVSPYEYQAKKEWVCTEFSQTYGERTWRKTFNFGSPTYNILGMFSTAMPAGTQISNIKVITWH